MRTNVHVESGEGATDRRVTKLNAITIEFSYPIDKPTTFSFESQNGFTLREFAACVLGGYRTIYKKARSYGVWGHCLGDLFIEGIEERSPGVFHLVMGS